MADSQINISELYFFIKKWFFSEVHVPRIYILCISTPISTCIPNYGSVAQITTKSICLSIIFHNRRVVKIRLYLAMATCSLYQRRVLTLNTHLMNIHLASDFLLYFQVDRIPFMCFPKLLSYLALHCLINAIL